MREALERELIERARARLTSRAAAEGDAPHAAKAATPGDGLEKDVLRLAAAALRMPEDRIDPDENLANYGVDSIAITEIMSGISRFFGVSIAPTTFFEARHLRDLAQILRARYGSAITAHYAAKAEAARPAPNPSQTPRDRAREVAGWLARHHAARANVRAETVAPEAMSPAAPAVSPAKVLAEPVAIIGMEGMFPKSPDLDILEAHLAAGRDCIEEIPGDRWNWRAVDGDPRRGPFSDVRYGGFVPGHDLFDAAFFNISPKEAELMDPQHRLFIECVWKLIEGAGHAPGSLSGRKVSLFLGINLQDYADLANRAGDHDPAQLTGLGHIFCANRLSFLLDINGPSQVIDTACSSSLVALHRAVQSIRHEGCEMAIAGGANLMLTPTQHILFARVGMLARDGRCKTFSRAANGYARAEGVGALLLKRLDLAERDGDHILGVIRGSSENHGGAASSLTAPNPRAQAHLIAEAHKQAGIDPRTISYMECHGTGTALGDPVEIEGLKSAFAEMREEHGLAEPVAPYCGLGSVKSNIGHTETAAGIAGVIKVLLGLRAGKLWQSLHCEEPNPLIDLRGSPFYLLDSPREWVRPVVDGHEAPRRAGVSSFGAGGANAHVVIEEYRDAASWEADGGAAHLIPLSARNETALREAASRLAAHLASETGAEQSLADIAHTLQNGRDAMRVRLACVARDKSELRALLEAFAQGSSHGVQTGTVERKGRGASYPGDTSDLAAVSAHWVLGGAVDWAMLHQGRRRARVKLPTYPFQRKRFWLPESTKVVQAEIPKPAAESGLALDEISPSRFRVRLHPDAFFLRDHVVGEAPTLPGVVYLELMRLALERAGLHGSLGQVVWLRPLVVTAPLEIEIAVLREAELQPRIEVVRVDEDGTRHPHAQARVVPKTEAAPARGDIAALEATHPSRHLAAEIYAVFDALGIAYGPTHRAIVLVAHGVDTTGQNQVFGRLTLPEGTPKHGFGLHPSLMDGAFQCALGMTLNEAGESTEGAALPFALDRIDIFGPCVPEMAVHIRVSAKGEQRGRVRALDVDLMDMSGVVRVRMQGFATRKLAKPASDSLDETLIFAPEWRPLALEASTAPVQFARRHVMLCGRSQQFADRLLAERPDWSFHVPQGEGEADASFRAHAQALLALVHKVAREPGSSLLQVVVPANSELLTGLSGLLRTARQEVPRLHCQLVALDPGPDPTEFARRLEAYAQRSDLDCIRDQGEAALAHRWRKLESDSAERRIPWRNGGVYLITGGSGGLGQLFAREIASHARDVTLILASRTSGDVERDAEFPARCSSNGARIEHAVLDVADADASSVLIAGIRTRHGRLDGVLHAAGLLDDGAITDKTPASLAAVLTPKVTGVCNLDRALGNEPLDLFLLFASISGALGNTGQADYAAANAFLDAFAKEREARRRAGLCQGRTLSVDWPLWRDGGMRMSEKAERLMTRTTGLVVLESASAFEALYQAFGTDEPQVLVVAGDRARIEAWLLDDKPAEPAKAATTQTVAASIDADELERKILSSLCDLVSAQLKVSAADLVPDAELSEYGFDSISFTQFANTLNDRFGLSLTPTVFFEHPTLDELAAHFSREHMTAFSSAFGVLPRAPVIEIADVSIPSAPTPVRAAPIPPSAPVAAPMARSPIAIVGMSGAFPGAGDPEALWRNLLAGHDAIRDVPPGRWDRAPRGDIQARGGFMDGVGEFDAAFFGLSAPEARTIDPQQRLLLTHTWRLLEDAGYAPRKLWGANVGVFIGIADTGYGRLVGQAGGPTEGYAMTGLAPSVGPNRVSFHFNFNGPSVAVETACSSALVAIHRAAEAIHSGDCTAAIAGGVNLLLSPDTFEGFTNAGMLARDGRSKTFSADADGYGRGEGIGLVFLKRLDEAERDGDRILAVIRGSAENHGGRANSLTAPNPKAQAALLKRAYERAGFDPRTVSYIETHGTGTPLGDPIEIEALSTAFAALSADAETSFGLQPPMACGIGSVKSNIGHLELAAGAAGLIKVLLQMRHGTLAPSLHCQKLNPYLKLEDSQFHVVRENAPWVRPRDADGRELPRRAGVSAFGFGGSNAHLVIEEYVSAEVTPTPAAPGAPAAIVLSARSEEQLRESAQNLHDALAGHPDSALAGIAFTLQTCRDPMEHRLAFLAASISEVRRRLAVFVAGETEAEVQTGRVKSHRDMMALLDSDADMRHALSGLGDRGRLDILMGLWLRGLPFDWRTLYGAHVPPRAELPGYPFARTIHWVRPAQDSGCDGKPRGAAAPMRAAAHATPAQSKAAVEASAPKGGAIDEKDAVNRALCRLTDIAARLLETETSVLDPDTELGEFGFDSISMTTFATKVNEELGLSLTPADFFEFATLARLARHIARSMPRPTDLDTHAEGAGAATVPVVVAPDFAPQRAPADDPIAIVGMSCTFPGAPDADAFWNNLISGQSSISEIPADRWDWREFHGDPKSESNKTNVRFGGFIDGVFEFDPLFFGISPREAALMDPQQRLMMTHAWKALEDAGHAPRSLAGQPVGLFVGTSSSGFCDLLDEDTGAEGYAATGSVPSVGPNRISYLLDWRGPSEPVETACSSSLVALHRAVQAMRAGDCNVAIVGGVNTIVTPEAHINFAKAGMLSPDGACKTFSSNANGYVRGEGVGMLVLKRLSQAERDGDAIYAVVRGSAINHGGRANSFTAPNTSAQAEVITRAYAQAGIDPATVGYIEAHGTGTALGDPVEINALKSAFATLPSEAAEEATVSPGCGLGSAKTNIGHLELAAGAAGVIKVLLQLRNRTLAPSLNSEPPNPYIDFRGSPFFVVREAQPWRAVRDASGVELPRRAGVSSFGFGGVNAHVVLEEYVDRRVEMPSLSSVVVPLSGRDEARLADQVRQLLDHLDRHTDLALADVAFTLQVGRTPLKHRLAFVVRSLEELRKDLGRFLAGDQKAGYHGIVGRAAVSSPAADPTPEEAAARWVYGGEVDWKHLDPAPRRRLHLPTYPFAREEYRAGRMPRGTSAAPAVQPDKHTTLSLDPTAFYLRDHRIAGAPVLPGAMTLELARAASSRPAPLSLKEIVWLKPVGAAADAQVRVAFDGEAFRLLTGDASAEVSHAQGRLGDAPDPAPMIDLDAIRARCERSRSPAWLYDTFASLGMQYGPAFRPVTQLACGHDEVLARLDLPAEGCNTGREFLVHPSMIDGALQACLALYDEANDGSTAVPFALERVEIFAPTTREMWAHVRARSAAGSVRKIDIDLADETGAVAVRLIGFSVRMLRGKATPRPSGEAVRESGVRYLTAVVAAETGVPVGEIELAASLDTYGIDSVMIVRLTDELEKSFGPLPKTLFFEHRTLDAVLTYFLEHHAERLQALTSERSASPRTLAAVSPKPESRREADLHAPIAIVGLAGRYPGARDLETFWDNLAAGRDCITELPLDRWDHSRVSGLERGAGAKWGGFVEGVAEFDPLFFNISPREAPYMDPQERLFLQCAYEAIEDSGYTRAALAEGEVGVFVGVMWEEYQLYGAERTAHGEPLALSSSPASIANRVSSVCDFHGPSIAVDSMCSSSLSAIHLACESLALGTCTAAVAGGVNLSLHPNKYLALTQGRFLSSSGRCESFGAGGDGYVPGEGVGAVVLKRLDRAVADGDHIYGVIRGSALNHGGKTNGYTVPNPQAQTIVIRRALEKAGVEPRQVSYVEAHGTGTKLGDPIEITALSKAYRAETPDTAFCAIGSVKSNIGHCESAAGIAGLTKVLLQMRHRRLAPSLHSGTLNPGIDFASSPFTVQRRLDEWHRPSLDSGDGPRIAGLSSFGAGGSNAHLIVEEYDAPSSAATASQAGPFVFPFSARDDAALDRVVQRFLVALETMDATDLAAAAHVLQTGREAFEVRLAVVSANIPELVERLRASLDGNPERAFRGVRRPGQGELSPATMEARDLDTIARAWCRGAHVEWQRLWRGSPPRRISLPTYPFARETYWVPGLETSPAASKPPVADLKARSAYRDPLPLLFTPDWQPSAAKRECNPEARRLVVCCELPGPTRNSRSPAVEIHELKAPGASLEQRFGHYAERILSLIQSLMKERSDSALLQVVVPREGGDVTLEGLGGLLRTAMQERTSLRCQLISVDASHRRDLGALIEAEARSGDTDIRYETGRRLVRRWRECRSERVPAPWKDGGVYLVTGGLGGLGLLLAEHVAGSVHRPTLWLTGRSAPSSLVLDRLAKLDATIVHRRLDVTDTAATAKLINEIEQTSGGVDGIVHAAGITRDKLLVRKSSDELREVLAPKVAGLTALDAASAGCDLDFMLLFASVSGALGNPGQADYAAANAFMDAFAERRSTLVSEGRRRGLTLSIDWPYWRDGGMSLSEGVITAMKRATGVTPLETTPAFAGLDAAVAIARAENLSQILILDGDHPRLRGALLREGEATESPQPQPTISIPEPASANLEAVTAYLASEIAAVLKVPADKLDANETFDRYGLDSVSALEVIDTLEAKLGAMPKTLLFEYPTVAKLAVALAETHAPALRKHVREPQPEAKSDEAESTPAHVAARTASPAVASEADIAIIAVAGRYPGADTPEALWEALREGRDLITEVPPDRWDIDTVFAAGKGLTGRSYCRWGGFLSSVDTFDAAFFGISPREAARMDPQERLFLETAWHVLERGGYPRQRLQQDYASKVGVFVGAMSQQYRAFAAGSHGDRSLLTLTSHASLANRVSYYFDLQGPSVAVDSMCSSGLEAVHLACQALRRRECRLAIAGAVNLSIHPDKYIGLSEAGLVGSHAGSRAFAGGDGYLPAEGVGAILLKPLADALAARDVILGVIKGTNVNHSGRSAGYGVPSAEAQQRLVEDNFREADIDPRTIGYVEAAATGAALGDAMEVRAMTRAFRSFTADEGFCAVGSVKANMGHAEAASGLAQLTKCLFQLQHRMLAPRSSAIATDPDVEFAGTPFTLQKELAPWRRMEPDQPLRASISSFGAGGTNVHLILEEAPLAVAGISESAASAPSAPLPFVFSAGSEEQLAAVMAGIARYVASEPDLSLRRLSWTLRTCRERLACTAEIVAADRQELLRKLSAWPAGQGEHGSAVNQPPADEDAGPPLILPDYPFYRTRHWLSGSDIVAASADTCRAHAEEVEPRTARELICALLVEETGLARDAIPATTPFRDLGAASMFSLRLIRAISDEFEVEITHGDLEVHENVDALAALIGERRRGAEPRVGISPAAADGDLSEGQLGLWLLQKLYPGMSTYNVPLAFRIADPDAEALERALAVVLERFPILARRIVDNAGTPHASTDPIPVEITELSMTGDADETAFLRERAAMPFDLSTAPPIRCEIISQVGRPGRAIVLIVAHHIAIDGLSATIVARTFWDAYACFAEGRALPPSSPTTDFSEFVGFERALLASEKGKAQLAYWRNRLAADLPALDLPADRIADPTQPITSASIERRLAPDLASAVHAATRTLRVNRPAFFLAVMNVLLYRYTGADDLLIGMPVMGRPARRFEKSVGCFANMVVTRASVKPLASAAELIAAVQSGLTEALDNADVPYAALVRELGRSSLDGPLYQVSFAYQNFFDRRPLAAGAEHIESIRQQGGDAFGIEMFEDGDTLRVVANYDAARFDAARVERMLDHFTNLAAAIAAAPHKSISALGMLSVEERDLILGPWATGGALPIFAGTVPEWVVAQAERTPEAVALIVGAERLTYGELTRQALALADHLAARGVGPGDRVAVLLERGAPAMVAMLGVLSTAAVYVPLDTAQPEARLVACLADAGVRAVIVDEANEARLSGMGVAIPDTVHIDREAEAIRKREVRWPRPVDRASAAYIIYTSGSTGAPKGVVVSHAALADHCRVMIDHYGLDDSDRVLQFSALNVDPSLEQSLTALISGASVVMRKDGVWTPAELRKVIEREDVTVADLPPAYFSEVLAAWDKSRQAPESLPRLWICGGEALSSETVRLWRSGPQAQSRLINAYGPTEATVTALTHEVVPADREGVPIGRPLPGTFVYILDDNGQPVPEGVPGQLYIGGSRVAIGYLGREDLTRERFLPNPFGEGRLYRTGDRVAFIPGRGGSLAFLGRVDTQIKIRGFRVELGEVEAALAACGVGQAAVIFLAGALIAVVAEDEATFDVEAIAAAMSKRLPGYMCPASYVRVDALPLTHAGKIDRARLKANALQSSGMSDVSHAEIISEPEQKMIGLWREVFGESLQSLSLGPDSDFFALGGHSLLAVRLLSAIERAYGQGLSMADLITAPTVADLVRLLGTREAEKSRSGRPNLVELRKGKGSPLFLMPPVGGSVSCYLALARALDIDLPIYGVEVPEEGGDTEDVDLSQRAAAFLAALHRVQPKGPYQLGGWSLGGVLAYEMARQLLAAGEKVTSLVLIDAYAPALLGGSGGKSISDALAVFARDLIGIFGSEPLRRRDGEIANSIADLYRVPELEPALDGVDPTRLARRFAIFSANLRMAEAYRPEPCALAAKLYVATNGHVDRTRGWSELLLRGLSTEDLPGDHYSVLAEPSVERLARLLAREIGGTPSVS